MICHGQGDPKADPFLGGCCFIVDKVCPNRWFIDWAGAIGPAETVYDSDRVVLGLVDDVIKDLVGNSKPRQQRVKAQALNVTFLCTAALAVIGADPSLLTDRPAFDAAWQATDEYSVTTHIFDPAVGPETVEAHWVRRGHPADWCMLFGPAEGQCCHREDQTTNDARAGVLDAVAVQVRSAATGAS